MAGVDPGGAETRAGGATEHEAAGGRRPMTAMDGPQWHALLRAGLVWLDQHHEIVNSLNVFPVPDGDTGTNMLLTLRAAVREADASAESVAEVTRAAASGALMGARGNSGVILSQILRGMARSLEGQVTLTGPRLAAALSEGSRVAYKGVNRPVEGTILTVIREAAAAAENAAALNPDLHFVIEQTVRAADAAVDKTPTLLPVLAQAGKVDSGGKGLFYILEGMHRELEGEIVEAPPAAAAPAEARRIAKGERKLPDVVYGFDVQFLVEGHDLDLEAIRGRITAMGDCPLIEGEGQLVKVHVHVHDPGVPLSYAVTLGFVTDVVVENMDDMHLPAAPVAAAASAGISAGPIEIQGPGIVTVAQGAGLADVFRSLGAHTVITGGQTMNPSIGDILEAIEQLNAPEVIVLPNNNNIIMAAQQAQALATAKKVLVVPSRSIPQGISALLAMNPQASLERNERAMIAALITVQTGEVTQAVQDAQFDGVKVKAGSMIGLLNDRLVTAGLDSAQVVKSLLETMQAEALEVISLYYGASVSKDEAERLQQELQARYPGQEIEIIDGGQPFYHYLISAE